ncbi:hypothetical protein ACHQM5_000227 [Ranunculus cassubicifolius]
MSKGIDAATKREIFNLCGPTHLTAVDWQNVHHRRSVAASLVKGVYVLERDRQKNRQGPYALAFPWWMFFNFQLIQQLIDEESIFGAIYEYRPPYFGIQGAPRYVIAFRGNIMKDDSIYRDLKLSLKLIRNSLHRTSRFEIAMQAVQNMVGTYGVSDIWIAGHSLGSAMAMLAGKNMANSGILLETFLFNPPFVSPPVDWIKSRRVKKAIVVAKSLSKAGLKMALKSKMHMQISNEKFVTLSSWVPSLFIHPSDHICSSYIGHFEGRKNMPSLFSSSFGKEESEPVHLLPSACVTTNLSSASCFKQAHEIHQWWKIDVNLQSQIYRNTEHSRLHP